MPELALVIPMWNQWAYSQACLESLCAPGYALPESVWLILIDNGSTDHTPFGLAGHLLARRARTIIQINLQNLGVAGAWNQGIGLACHPLVSLGPDDWIGIINNDTLWPRDWVPRLLALDAEVVSPSWLDWTHLHPAYQDIQTVPPEVYRRLEDAQRVGTAPEPGFFGAAFFCRRRVFDQIGRFTQFGLAYFEDTEFKDRLAAAGIPAIISHDIVMHYFQGKSVQQLPSVGDTYREAHRNYEQQKGKLR